MVASCPSLRCSWRKNQSYAEKQRVWICYNTAIVLSVVLCDCCKPTSNCWSRAFSNSELDVWLPAFQLLLEAGRPAFELPMFAKGDALPKGDVLYMFVSGIHSRHSSWNSKPTQLTRSLRFLRAAAGYTSSALWFYHAHPFVAAAEKKQFYAEKQRVWPRSCRIQDLLRPIQWFCPRFAGFW